MQRLLEGFTYYDLNVSGTGLIWGPALIRGNMVRNHFSETSNSCPLIRTRACAYRGITIAIFSCVSHALNEWNPCHLYNWRFDWLISWITKLDIFYKGLDTWHLLNLEHNQCLWKCLKNQIWRKYDGLQSLETTKFPDFVIMFKFFSF